MSQERDQQEAALRESEAMYRTLFNQIDKGLCLCEMLLDDNGTPYDYRFLEVNSLFEEHTGLVNATGKTALELVPNLERHWIDLYGKVALYGEPLRFEQGSQAMGRWFDVYAFPFGGDGTYRFGIIFNDITQRKIAEDRSQLLQSLASALSNALTQQELTDIIIHKGVVNFGATGVTIALLTDEGNELEIIGTYGYEQSTVERWKRIPIDHPTAPIGLAIRKNHALWIRDAKERELILPLSEGLSQQEIHQAWAVIPFNINNSIIGAIGLGFDKPTDFDLVERNFLLTLAEYYGQALYRAKLTGQLTLLAASRERQRLARDLHDSVKQLLFASSVIAQSLPRMWEKSTERATEYTRDVVNLNMAALAELQTLLLEMRPQAIITSPFMALVNNLCNGLRGHQPIDIEVNYQGPDELFLPPDVHIAMYRLTQETLNNVNKHSDASHLSIDCQYDGDVFIISIGDDGKGFDLDEVGRGMGLHSMRERAESIGAIFRAESVPGGGTCISVEWHRNGK